MPPSDPYRPDVLRRASFQVAKGEGSQVEYFDRQLAKRANPSAIIDLEGDFACLRFDFPFYTHDLYDLICWVSKGPPQVFLLGSGRYLKKGVITDPELVTDASSNTADVVDVIGRLIGRQRWHRPYLDHFRDIPTRVEFAVDGVRHAIQQVEGGFVRRKIKAIVREPEAPDGNYEWRPGDPHVVVGGALLVTRKRETR